MKRIISLVIVFLLSTSTLSFAHSGRTDSYGGHYDYNNVSGLGSYHYHHGYGPHLHPGGVCPHSKPSSKSKTSESKIKKIKKRLEAPIIYDMLSKKTGMLTIYWDKEPAASGYKVLVALDSKYTKGVKVHWVNKTKTAKTFKKLKSGKKYYAKIQSYKKISGKKVVGNDYDFMGPVRVE